MGFIEAIRKHRSVGIACSGGLFVLAVGVALWGRSNTRPPDLTKAYFSTDDGKTFFVDDLNKPYPFDHNGQQAYRAYVYKGADGVPYVAYLERFTEKGLARRIELAQQSGPTVTNEVADLFRGQTEVKKPGVQKWVSNTSPQEMSVTKTDPASREMYP